VQVVKHLVVFDLDGTLVDSRLDLAGSANRLLAHFDAGPLSIEEVVGMVGDGARVLVARVLAAANVTADVDTALARFLDIYDTHVVDHTRLYPGVLAGLQALESSATLALLTNKPAHHTGRLLEALGISGYFVDVIGGDSRWPRKPDPSALRHVMAAAGALADTTIMVGDSMVDVETARRAPARICVARYGFGHVPDDATAGALVVDDPAKLGEVLLRAIAPAAS